jgi:glycine/D-amino acid oxidase-like deaminating enzyme
MLNICDLSYWEYKSYFKDIDFIIVGSGIVGLNTAICLKKRYPKSKILVIERGYLPTGASTKNAGFTCFGSPTEILSDLKSHSEEEVISLIQKRWNGLQKLLTICGKKQIDYYNHGSQELFTKKDEKNYELCCDKLSYLNDLVFEAIGKKGTFQTSSPENYPFRKVVGLIKNNYEGQIDTGKMMNQLIAFAFKNNIKILNNITVKKFSDHGESVELETSIGVINCKKLFIATNGLSQKILPKEDLLPARAQVLITSPVENLDFKGTFHYDSGYYYFRNVGNRVLLGGGRNLDFKGETTTEMTTSTTIMNSLEKLLREVIIPNKSYAIERRWSGIMGVGKTKKPIVKNISQNVRIGIRLGGMGVAIGSLIGEELALLGVHISKK